MNKRAFKDAIYGEFARIAKAIGSPQRLELLDLLCQRAWTVEELATEANLSVANTSRHLQVLRGAKLVDAQKKGLFVSYSVAADEVAAAFHAIRALAEKQLAEIDRITKRFVAGREEFASIDRSELVRRLRDGSALLLDVRPASEFEHDHIEGAVSIPVEELPKRLRELPRGQQVVAYCRGPYCLFASDAVRMLRARGFDAVRYDGSATTWKAGGSPARAPRPARAKS